MPDPELTHFDESNSESTIGEKTGTLESIQLKVPFDDYTRRALTRLINSLIPASTPAVTPIEGRSHGTSTTSIPGGFTPTKVAYNTNDFANGITWDGTNHRFTALTAGVYIITASCTYNGVNAGNQYEIALYKNGGQISTARQQSSVTGGVFNIQVTDILTFAVNDYIEAFTQHSDAGAINIFNATSFTWLSIAKV